jgi:hypothetical protein
MKFKIAGGLLLIAVVILLQATVFMRQVPAQANCEGKWARLSAYAGSYDTDAVLDDSDVKAAISKMLGTEAEHFLANLSVRGTADLIGCNLVIEGNADHAGGEEHALLVVELASGTVTAGMLTAGRFKIYTSGVDYSAVPIVLKDWMAVVSSGFNFRFDAPANADVISVGP